MEVKENRPTCQASLENVPSVTSIEVTPFWDVGDGRGFLLCKMLSSLLPQAGGWESGNPAFGFPVLVLSTRAAN